MKMQEIVDQLELCKYECEGGPLENNVAFVALRVIAEEGMSCSLCVHHTTGERHEGQPCNYCFSKEQWDIDVHSDICKKMFNDSKIKGKVN